MENTLQDVPDALQAQFSTTVETMSKSIADARVVIRKLCEKKDSDELDIKDGISLLSLKHLVMLNYLHSLALLTAQRVVGCSLAERTPPSGPFQSSQRTKRGNDAGDLVDSLIQDRLILEKSKALESRMRYQIEKLVRIAAEPLPNRDIEDPLSFRPNPDNFAQDEGKPLSDDGGDDAEENDGIYRPPKIAPMPYNEPSTKEKRRERVPAALSALVYQNPNEPYLESTSGLGGPSKRSLNASSARARELARMTEYEESHMTRLVLNKKEAKRRRQDEETLALGGTISGSQYGRGHARGAGFADEFGDLLRAKERRNNQKDEYEELRARSKKQTAFERSKTRGLPDDAGIEPSDRPRKRTKFQKEVRKFNKQRR
ncbi:hypothetical protein FRC17_007908 [Serendipita sp. 399]|nr:hypothetical protein FRC17_007908 [Serendipita sp. 399]